MSEVTHTNLDFPPPAPAGRNWRPVWFTLIGIGAATVLVPLLVATVVVGPYLRDDWRLDHIVRAVALDWRDFGEAKAKERLQFELDRQGVGPQIGDDTCKFTEADGARALSCVWQVQIGFPGAKTKIPLSFVSEATVRADGDLD